MNRSVAHKTLRVAKHAIKFKRNLIIAAVALIGLALLLIIPFLAGLGGGGPSGSVAVVEAEQQERSESTITRATDYEDLAPFHRAELKYGTAYEILVSADQHYKWSSDSETFDDEVSAYAESIMDIIDRGKTDYPPSTSKSLAAGVYVLGNGTYIMAIQDGHAQEDSQRIYEDQSAYEQGQATRGMYIQAISIHDPSLSDSQAERIYDRALSWYMGHEYIDTDTSFTAGMICTVDSEGLPETLTAQTTRGTVFSYGKEQLNNAALIIGAAGELGHDGAKIALATALVESNLWVYANDGTHRWNPQAPGGLTQAEWNHWSQEITKSLDYPHQKVGRDYDSIGLFQQRPAAGWGSIEELMDPVRSATKFYDRIRAMSGWNSRPPGEVAADIQRPAPQYRTRYAEYMPIADRILSLVDGAGCTGIGSGIWVHPVPIGGAYSSSYGPRPPLVTNSGVVTGAFHAGVDISAPEGTALYAASGGRVIDVVRVASNSFHPKYGVSGCMVAIDHGAGVWSTYNHMVCSSITVAPGQEVTSGQHIAQIGSTGNVTGPHLHFQIFVGGKHVNPDPFMRERCIDMRVPSRTIEGCTPPDAQEGENVNLSRAIEFARDKIGDSYVYGANGPNQWDCSSLVQQAFAASGQSLPRTSLDQWVATTEVQRSNLAVGDLVFYSRDGKQSGIYHVAIYTGNGKVVHAANPQLGVLEASMSEVNLFGFGRVGTGLRLPEVSFG